MTWAAVAGVVAFAGILWAAVAVGRRLRAGVEARRDADAERRHAQWLASYQEAIEGVSGDGDGFDFSQPS